MIIFLEPTIKLMTGIFDLQNGTSAFSDVFSEKDPHLNAVEFTEKQDWRD